MQTIINKNKINPSGLYCYNCGKNYKTRLYLDRHLVLCEIYYKSRNNSKSKSNQNQNENEEEIIVPSQKRLYQIILELSLKCNKLENKVNELSKFMTKKLKKIDVLDYLNTSVINKPNIIFENITELIKVSESDIEYFFNNSYLDTMNHILSKKIYNNEELELPVKAFIQKPNNIYIFDKTNENINCWQIMPREKLIRFLNIIQLKISKAFSEWRKNNLEYKDDDKLIILYDKTFSKLMTPEFKLETIYNKYYNNFYNKIKKELNINSIDIEINTF
jgi:hypothetical protein